MGFPFLLGGFEKGTFSQMSQLNQRDFDQFGNTPDYEIENLIALNDVSSISDFSNDNAMTLLIIADIEMNIIPQHEITVLFSTFKDVEISSNADKLVLKNLFTFVCSVAYD